MRMQQIDFQRRVNIRPTYYRGKKICNKCTTNFEIMASCALDVARHKFLLISCRGTQAADPSIPAV